jgi:hypothetical protein
MVSLLTESRSALLLLRVELPPYNFSR